jgi:pyrroloquinoline quinone biosynthesis protein D
MSASHPKLARRARMKWDELESRWMLLYPERGLALNETAAEIVKLCDGTHTVEEIVAALARASVKAETVDRDVRNLLTRLAEKNLLE